MNLNILKNIIKESSIKEIGDLKNIQTYSYQKIKPNSYTFETEFGNVDVNFDEFFYKDWEGFKVDYNQYDYSGKVYNISYTIDDVTSQIEKTNYKELIKIMSTIRDIVEDFISSSSPYALLMFGIDKSGGVSSDKQKNSLYLLLASKHLPPNYRISKATIKDPGIEYKGYVMFKK